MGVHAGLKMVVLLERCCLKGADKHRLQKNSHIYKKDTPVRSRATNT